MAHSWVKFWTTALGWRWLSHLKLHSSCKSKGWKSPTSLPQFRTTLKGPLRFKSPCRIGYEAWVALAPQFNFSLSSIWFPLTLHRCCSQKNSKTSCMQISDIRVYFSQILTYVKGLRDGMGREVGGGFRMGNTCTSMADSCQCMAKTTTLL